MGRSETGGAEGVEGPKNVTKGSTTEVTENKLRPRRINCYRDLCVDWRQFTVSSVVAFFIVRDRHYAKSKKTTFEDPDGQSSNPRRAETGRARRLPSLSRAEAPSPGVPELRLLPGPPGKGCGRGIVRQVQGSGFKVPGSVSIRGSAFLPNPER